MYIFCLLCLCATSNAQSITSNLKKIQLPYADTLKLDTVSIDAASVQILNVPNNTFTVNAYTAQIYFTTKPKQDTLQITYRTLNYNFTKIYNKKSPNLISKNMGKFTNNFYEYNSTTANASFADFGNLDYNGSLSRGLNFGNNQDVVLNSQFNLQLSGMLADSVELLASITDNNIPFQPNGNTQNIQEFDRVFLQFKRNKAQLTVGDYEMNKPNNYFMHFYKRVQGLYFSNENILDKKNTTYKYGIGASLAKGKFVRQQLTAIEGNQGPYKVPGPNNETYLIIMANSEKIFIDGLLLQRGEDKDYIIDYNNAEVIFMPKKMITKDSRIIVEYEVNDRNYLNSLLYSTNQLTIKKGATFYLHAYSNQDAKNQQVQQNLDANQQLFLSTVGDNLEQALYNNSRKDTFGAAKIMYKKIDSTISGNTYPIYIFSTNKDSAQYIISFTYAGPGKGDYMLSANTANGRVYSWIAPLFGTPQGEYIPFTQLVTPKRQQLFVAGTQLQLNKNNQVLYEVAISNNDPNLFSKINNNNHIGMAHKLGYNTKQTINKKWILNNTWHYEWVQQKFRPLERFRETEFNRDWSLPFIANTATEQYAFTTLQLNNSKNIFTTYGFSWFNRGTFYNGTKHALDQSIKIKNTRIIINANHVQSSFNSRNSKYTRPSIAVEQIFPKWHNATVGIKCSLENNSIRTNIGDTLDKTAFRFDVAQVYSNINTTNGNTLGFNYFTRKDYLPINNNLKAINQSQNLSLNNSWSSLKNQTINITATYRSLNVIDTSIYKIKPEQNILGRIDYGIRLFNNGLTYNIIYELGSGQELRREFAYLEVPAGQGTHLWNDYNTDGLQQLNEFEIAQYQDQKRFIKIFTPTNNYVKAKYNTTNQSISINFKQLNKNKNKLWYHKLSNPFMLTSSLILSNKNLSESGLAQYSPWYKASADSIFINNSLALINTIFFNRYNTTWGIDFVQNITNNRSLLTYGIDTRNNADYALKLRWNITKTLTHNFNVNNGRRAFNSPFLNSRNYTIQFYNIEPAVTFLSKNGNNRLSANYKWEQKQNSISTEKAIQNIAGIEYKLSKAGSTNYNFRINYNNIKFNGDANSPVGFVMLEGLQNGNNFLWLTSLEKKLAKGLEMSLEYEGRKPDNVPVIHTGRATMRAIF